MTEQPPAGTWTTCERTDVHTWHPIDGTADAHCVGLREEGYYLNRNNPTIVTTLN